MHYSCTCTISGYIVVEINIVADHGGREVCGMNCLRSLESRDREFEFHSRYGCLCVC
jgi:hypothetical protein